MAKRKIGKYEIKENSIFENKNFFFFSYSTPYYFHLIQKGPLFPSSSIFFIEPLWCLCWCVCISVHGDLHGRKIFTYNKKTIKQEMGIYIVEKVVILNYIEKCMQWWEQRAPQVCKLLIYQLRYNTINLPQLELVRPINWLVSEFHINCVNPFQAPSFSGRT